MKLNKTNLLIFSLLVLAAALYRAWADRPMGFAPQIAMALFAGSVIKDKKFAFLFPLASLFVSDIIYQLLYSMNLTGIKGFYSGQITNYILFTSITVIGFFMNKQKVSHILIGSLAGAVYYFIVSNLMVWIGGGWDINNQPYEKSFSGLMLCFTEALPFFRWSLVATFLFNGVFFGTYYLMTRKQLQSEIKTA